MTPRNGHLERAEMSKRGLISAAVLAVLSWNVTAVRAGEPLRVNNLVNALASNHAPEAASAFETGRYEIFESDDSRLVPGDTNESTDIYVRDTKTGRIERVSMGDFGVQTNGPSRHGFISANGRFVAFESDATNLVKGDSNGLRDVFLHDRREHTTIRISLRGLEGQADRACRIRGIAADGKTVLFESDATNLVKGDTNGACDVFVREWKRDRTRRVSISSTGAQGDGASYNASMSADGRNITFDSKAANLLADASSHTDTTMVRDLRLGSTAPLHADVPTMMLADTPAPKFDRPIVPATALVMVSHMVIEGRKADSMKRASR